MEKISFYYLVVVAGVFVASFSQIMLKQSARDNCPSNWFSVLLQKRVLFAYFLLFCVYCLNIFAMSKGVCLKDLPILESLGYVFVPVMAKVFFRERMTFRVLCSMALIVTGICVFNL